MLVHRPSMLNLDTIKTIQDFNRECEQITKVITNETKIKSVIKTIELVEEMVRHNYFAFEIVGSTLLKNQHDVLIVN